jgi:hypothetical protein
MTSLMMNVYLKESVGLAQVFRIEHISWYNPLSRYSREIR